MTSEREFKHESLQDRESIIRYLNTITEGFGKGEIIFRSDSEQIILKPWGLLKLEIKASQKDDKIKLSLKFVWKERDTRDDDKKSTLIIEPKA